MSERICLAMKKSGVPGSLLCLFLSPISWTYAASSLDAGTHADLPDIIFLLSSSGWKIPDIVSESQSPISQSGPIPMAANVSRGDPGKFSRAVANAMETGRDFHFNRLICTDLGLTEGDPCFVKAVILEENGVRKQFMASQEPEKSYVLFGYKNDEKTGTLFLTTLEGKFVRCVLIHGNDPLQDVPYSEALPDFEKEKAFWIERLR